MHEQSEQDVVFTCFHNLLYPPDGSREVIDDSARFCTEKACHQIHHEVREISQVMQILVGPH